MRSDPQIKFRAPVQLKTHLAASASGAGRSLTAELVLRLEQSFSPAPHSAAQHQLALAPAANAQAEQLEAAGRVFSTTMQVAERMGTGRRRALDFAIRHTKRVTGIDWGEELRASVSTPRSAAPADSPAMRFLSVWRAGELSLPWAPSLFVDLHSACLRWCARERLPGMPPSQFAQAIEAAGTARRQRKRWLLNDVTAGPAVFVLPLDAAVSTGQSEREWLGDCVIAFRKAAKRVRLSP